MIIEPKVRGFICTTAHPDGCRENVKQQIEYVKSRGRMEGPSKVLVIGGSTGYGLASRIAAAFGCGAATLGIMFEKVATEKRTATPGWYNTMAFEGFAEEDGLYARTLNGDAFSMEMKEQTVQVIREDLGQIDMVIYSLAAPRRTMPDGTVYSSVLKTTNGIFTNKSLNLRNNQIEEASISPASQEETAATVKVMGGEDWMDWMRVLSRAGVLAPHFKTLAYSYIGPELTYPVYYEGTIGMAKQHLCETARKINQEIPGAEALVSVNKALVTQASSAIPIVPLYMAILYHVMKEKGLHEGCIQQMDRLFREKLAGQAETDGSGLIRLDDYEMREDVQSEVMRLWEVVNTENLRQCADLEGYWEDFYHMFGFGFENVDYTRDVPLT